MPFWFAATSSLSYSHTQDGYLACQSLAGPPKPQTGGLAARLPGSKPGLATDAPTAEADCSTRSAPEVSTHVTSLGGNPLILQVARKGVCVGVASDGRSAGKGSIVREMLRVVTRKGVMFAFPPQGGLTVHFPPGMLTRLYQPH